MLKSLNNGKVTKIFPGMTVERIYSSWVKPQVIDSVIDFQKLVKIIGHRKSFYKGQYKLYLEI